MTKEDIEDYFKEKIFDASLAKAVNEVNRTIFIRGILFALVDENQRQHDLMSGKIKAISGLL